MEIVKNPIIPSHPTFYGEKDQLDLKAICVFVATGFFLDQDTYYKGLKVLKPAHEYHFEKGRMIKETPYFKWQYSPVKKSFEETVSQFTELFERIIDKQVGNQNVILPLSGGLDSRTQAAALSYLNKKVASYSYQFDSGHFETKYAKKIADTCHFPFQDLRISSGYLWREIENLAHINQCYSEFTHPRQMAVLNQLANMGEVFSLGHWGDVLFDDMHVPDEMPFEQQVETILKKIIKKGGLDIANALWRYWNLEGEFYEYLYGRIRTLHQHINITQNANAAIRAFKSLYWAPRWTSVNLSIFEQVHPITLPYYEDEMCEFITKTPEEYLAGRKIQIAYLKKRNPELAKIAWQEHKPFNLYYYKWDKPPYNFPYRAYTKIKRTVSNHTLIQRNWELQFLGTNNKVFLEQYLFENKFFSDFIDPEIVKEFYTNFTGKDAVYYSHPISMLLTLSLFTKKYHENN